MPAGIKIKSVSVEDLGSIVKQMINGALENTAQIAKLHQAVYEEWYFKKLAELKGSKSTETQVTLNQDPEQTQDSAGEKNNLRDKKPFFPSNISINLVVKNESARLKIRSQIFNTPINHCKFNSLMFLRDHQASTEDTNIDDKPENIVTSDGTHTDIEIIEVWNNNNNAQKRKLDKGEKYNPTKTDCKTQNNKTKCNDQNSKNRLPFEVWKKQKNIKYKQMMKQQQKEQQELLQAQLAEMESRRAAQTYVRMRKQQEKQQKRKISKETRAIEQANLKLSEKQMEMKRSINNKVFKEWKRQKDIKLKEQRMRNNAYQQYANYLYHQQRQQLGLVDFVQGIDNKFNSWLNQLDWVLHEKYLRERRYLVRSFYCQPAYYGNAADIVYSKRQ